MISLVANSEVMGAAGFGGFPPCLASLDLSFGQVGVMTVMVLLLIPAVVGVRSMVVTPKHEIANKPLDVEVSRAPEYVDKSEIVLRQQAVEQRVLAIEKRQAEMDAKLGHEIGALRKDIGDLHGRITNGMQVLNDKIANMPSEIINLLNATRNLTK